MWLGRKNSGVGNLRKVSTKISIQISFSSWLILEQCLHRARFQENQQKTVSKNKKGKQWFEVHNAGEANISIQTLSGWKGTVELHVPPAETPEKSCLAIGFLCRSIAIRSYGLGVGINWNSCLGIDFMEISQEGGSWWGRLNELQTWFSCFYSKLREKNKPYFWLSLKYALWTLVWNKIYWLEKNFLELTYVSREFSLHFFFWIWGISQYLPEK